MNEDKRHCSDPNPKSQKAPTPVCARQRTQSEKKRLNKSKFASQISYKEQNLKRKRHNKSKFANILQRTKFEKKTSQQKLHHKYLTNNLQVSTANHQARVPGHMQRRELPKTGT